jgi:hypothetical protein
MVENEQIFEVFKMKELPIRIVLDDSHTIKFIGLRFLDLQLYLAKLLLLDLQISDIGGYLLQKRTLVVV